MARRLPPRRLLLERLESRHLLSGNGLPVGVIPPVHNSEQPTDVDLSGETTVSDLRLLFQHLQTSLEEPGEGESVSLFFDVDNNGAIAVSDLRLVLVHLLHAGEPEPPSVRHNAAFPVDVDGDGALTRADVQLLNAALSDPVGTAGAWPEFSDANDDGSLSQSDLDLVMAEFEAASSDAVVITETDVESLLDRGAAASASNGAIIAVVDRNGTILGVRVESEAAAAFAGDVETLVFAIDGAIAKARAAAFFSSNTAPLTSRTVRFISQSTITQREVESNPNIADWDSPERGPGFVAPIGVGGHFPPEVRFTPQVDLFAIEHQSRDSSIHPGEDGIKQDADTRLTNRFNVDSAYIYSGDELVFPESFGFQSEMFVNAQSRGIGTLPGGVPLYKDGELVGGIGVFFPGPDGFATHEQNFVHSSQRAGIPQTERERTNSPLVLESEWIAFAAAGGSAEAGASVGQLGDAPALEGYDLPFGRIDLVGITLEIYGPHPTREFLVTGIERIQQIGSQVGRGSASDGTDMPVTPGGLTALAGEPVPDRWLVAPHSSSLSGGLTAAQVKQIIDAGIAEADLTRAAIRLPLGERTSMVLAVADTTGEVLGLYRMPDATVFSIDVAVAKARNTAYYADASALVPADMVDDDGDLQPDVPRGAAFTNRTFRFLAEPRFPTGAEEVPPGAFSILNDPGINPVTAENIGAALPASVYASETSSVLAWDAFRPATNFRDPDDALNQNGIVFFPGSSPLYLGEILVGGLGVSGDGVDQDDVVTAAAQIGYDAPIDLRADQFFVRNIRLPYQKFNRNPRG